MLRDVNEKNKGHRSKFALYVMHLVGMQCFV